VVAFVIFSVSKSKSENNVIEDNIKFRNEYMGLNDKTDEKTGHEYLTVLVSDNNTVKYISQEDAINMLEKGTGIIYFGYDICPVCRIVVPTLTKVFENKNETLYYVDTKDMTSSFKLDNGEVKKEKDGSELYPKFLKILDQYLPELYIADSDGNRYDAHEKMIISPMIVAVRNGKVTNIKFGDIIEHNNIYEELSEKEISDLSAIIEKIIDDNANEACTQENC
jgi:hypothetical protein